MVIALNSFNSSFSVMLDALNEEVLRCACEESEVPWRKADNAAADRVKAAFQTSKTDWAAISAELEEAR
jgi:hypothetical protein